MSVKWIATYSFREFRVVIGLQADGFVAVAFDAANKQVARTEPLDEDSARKTIAKELLGLSEDFVDYETAIELFLRAFPGGFSDPFFDHYERNYKMRAVEKARSWLSKESIEAAMSSGDFSRVTTDAKRTFTNLIFPNEAMKFSDFMKSDKVDHEGFARALFTLLHEPHRFDDAFNRIVFLLKPYGAAKWTIMTYWPFLMSSEEHIFMKPEVAVRSAHALGYSLDYESEPSATIYRQYQTFAQTLRAGISALQPRDMIDVQTFMYTVGKEGFVRQAELDREKWVTRTGG